MGRIDDQVVVYEYLCERFAEKTDLPKNLISYSRAHIILKWFGLRKQIQNRILMDMIKRNYLKRIDLLTLKINYTPYKLEIGKEGMLIKVRK